MEAKKEHIIIMIISIFMMTGLRSMEADIQTVKAAEVITVKKTNTQKKRAARKRAKQRKQNLEQEAKTKKSLDERIAHGIEVDLACLRDNGTLENIREMLNSSNTKEYAHNLKIIANSLLLQAWLVKKLKAVSVYTENLVNIAYKNFSPCFSVSEDGKGLCGHDKDEMGDTKILLTSEGKNFALKFLPTILNSEDFWNNSEKINEFSYQSDKSINDQNAEVACVAQYVKSRIESHFLGKKIAGSLRKDINRSYRIFLRILSNINFSTSDKADEVEDLIMGGTDIKDIIKEWLEDESLLDAQDALMPNFISIAEQFYYFEEHLGSCSEDDFNFSNLDTAMDLNNRMSEIIELYENFEIAHKELYSIILKELNDGIRSKKFESDCKQVHLMPKSIIEILPDTLDMLLLSIEDLAKKTDIEFEFISEVVAYNKQQNQINSPAPKKKKKRSRRRNNKKRPIETQESQEVTASADELQVYFEDVDLQEEEISKIEEAIELPRYAERILNWFNPEYIQEVQPDNSSLFYHTYNPLADYFIKKYGYKQLEENKTNPDETDTAYYIAARFKYKNGEVTDKLLKIVFGEDDSAEDNFKEGFCYHRGPIEVDRVQEIYEKFSRSITCYDFPQIRNVLTKNTVKLIEGHPNAHLYKDLEYIEGTYHVEMYDSRNEVTITLFKL